MSGVSMRMKKVDEFGKVKRILSKQALYDRIGIRIIQWIDQNFKEEGTEKKWTPLRASTIFARRKNSSKILQNTGRLKQEVTHKASSQSVVIGWPTDSVAKYHHYGTPGPYEIRPKNKKALKFFMPPGAGSVLQRHKKGTPNVGLVSAAAARQSGLKMPAGKGKLQSVAFAQVVIHPGLPVRQLLPSLPLAKKLARMVVDDAIKEVVNG